MVSGDVSIRANWRNNPDSPGESIRAKFEARAREIYNEVASGKQPPDGHLSFKWALSGEPYATPEDDYLVAAVTRAVGVSLGRMPELSGGGGTSDGGTVSAIGAKVVELGVQGGSIHMANESIPANALDELVQAYKAILGEVLIKQ